MKAHSGKKWLWPIAALALALSTTPVNAEGPEWMHVLALEAEREIGCDIAFLVGIDEHEMDGQGVIDVQVNCTDGRAFDAHREDPAESFEFTRCEDSEIKAC